MPSPHKGVHWHKAHRQWEAQLFRHSKKHHLGYFELADAEAAGRAVEEAERADAIGQLDDHIAGLRAAAKGRTSSN